MGKLVHLRLVNTALAGIASVALTGGVLTSIPAQAATTSQETPTVSQASSRNCPKPKLTIRMKWDLSDPFRLVGRPSVSTKNCKGRIARLELDISTFRISTGQVVDQESDDYVLKRSQRNARVTFRPYARFDCRVGATSTQCSKDFINVNLREPGYGWVSRDLATCTSSRRGDIIAADWGVIINARAVNSRGKVIRQARSTKLPCGEDFRSK